jgi:hypothetical protein
MLPTTAFAAWKHSYLHAIRELRVGKGELREISRETALGARDEMAKA